MRSLARALLLAVAIAAGTWTVGWWTVPAIALAWSLLAPAPHLAAREAGIGGLAGWGALLVFTAAAGAATALATRVAGVMQLPPVALWAATLLFPAILAWSVASIGVALRRVASTRRA